MKGNFIETTVGLLVIITAISFFSFVYGISNNSKANDGYLIKASFQNIDGVNSGSDVKLSGIKIGFVDKITLDKDTYFAEVNIKIENGVEIPNDSRAAVSTSGLLGGKYISISPGFSEKTLAANETIKFTQSALNLEDIISKLMYSVTGGK